LTSAAEDCYEAGQRDQVLAGLRPFALASERAGRLDEAVTVLAHQTAGRALDRAQALEDAAVLLAGRGDLPAARQAFTDAARLYRALGATWEVRRVNARMRRHGIQRRRRGQQVKPTRGWGALTPAETKIAYMVAEGRSDPEIAAELFLSRNTVQAHVSHILAQLGARSRAEIIRQALRRPPPG
jgi:DNA-binding CsgD family transcriptional regulator